MGIVYEAVDPVIGRTVAVKTICVESSANSDFLLDRLFREARSAGGLAHPNIVIIFDVGRDVDVAYIAMERVDGPTLEALLVSNPTPSHPVLLDILRQTADALDHAHENGIVHRDIKPANIMLHKGKVVKVTDFGIAKIQDAQHHTPTGMVLGTPSYMSPEQIRAKPLDGRSDQFSLAVIAFEMLTGAMPFHGEDLVSLAHQIVYEEPPSATVLKPGLPSAVDKVLRRALAKDPNGRYRTCAEFVAALDDAIKVRPPIPPREPIRTSTIVEPPPKQEPPAVAVRTPPSKNPLWYVGGTHSPAPKPGDVKVNPKDNLPYVWIPPGTFTMGCSPGDGECYDDEKPAHQVTLTRGFWIGQTEVTQEAYERVIGKNPSHFRGDKLPVENVNWNEARAYCNAVGMRLPTEAEWEYAARGGNASARYGSLDAVAWYSGNSGSKTHEVGQKEKNAYGLYDMLGNVWEWTADWYDAKYYASSPPNDPPGPSSGQYRALRGGSWLYSAGYARASYRARYEPEFRYVNLGLRCAGD